MRLWYFDLFVFLNFASIFSAVSFVQPDEADDIHRLNHHNIRFRRSRSTDDSEEVSIERGRRVVGGEDASFKQFPHQVALMRPYFACGGSLVHRDWVMTAAHCVVYPNGTFRDKDKMEIIAGMLDRTRSDDEESTRQRRKLVAVYPHEDYNDTMVNNDIALLRLNESIELNEVVRVVCINDRVVTEKAELYASGWGVTNKSEGHLAHILQYARLDYVDPEFCTQHMPYITEKKLCAGKMEGGTDTCQGDSGGPLVVVRQADGILCLAGLTSYGHSCALPELPGVYTNVEKYVDWIRERSGGDVSPCA